MRNFRRQGVCEYVSYYVGVNSPRTLHQGENLRFNVQKKYGMVWGWRD